MGTVPHAKESGYEPWVRLSVERGDLVEPRQAAEILASLDAARVEVHRLRERIARVQRGVESNGWVDDKGIRWVTDESVQRSLGGAA